ncbi:hypothetical protein AVEN_175577-1 [Araneus ventricosus]|uniref:Uncharacterized protein n=1 Tax=Araneus ventricosus TaxID=182803 RepID=A0A4Y2I3V8_ARAVE|nr:hypothetical protein AVEN_175577-1 [Araneus ventricosus]
MASTIEGVIESPNNTLVFCTDVDTSHEWELHCFINSSQSAYGSIAYLKFSHLDETKTTFVISKSRVAPLKILSLPRLELITALVGARLIASSREYFLTPRSTCEQIQKLYYIGLKIILADGRLSCRIVRQKFKKKLHLKYEITALVVRILLTKSLEVSVLKI